MSGKKTFRNPKQNRVVRLHVWLRHSGRCYYCMARIGLRDMTMDHFNPSSAGGRNHSANLVCSCSRCNEAKDDVDGALYLRWVRRDSNEGKVWPWPAQHSAALTSRDLCRMWGALERESTSKSEEMRHAA